MLFSLLLFKIRDTENRRMHIVSKTTTHKHNILKMKTTKSSLKWKKNCSGNIILLNIYIKYFFFQIIDHELLAFIGIFLFPTAYKQTYSDILLRYHALCLWFPQALIFVFFWARATWKLICSKYIYIYLFS